MFYCYNDIMKKKYICLRVVKLYIIEILKMVIFKLFDGFIGKYIFNMFCSFYVYEYFGGNKNLFLNLCFIYFIENR